MIESFVDLTYRGLSLGRRVRLGEVRPNSGYLELPSPMPVGARIAIATDDGISLDATVSWVYEQVAGSDRAPGIVVTPDLSSPVCDAWWKTRVALSDDEPARPRGRTRPVTARRRTPTASTPPSARAPASDTAAIAADLSARVAAAAGLPRAPAANDAASSAADPAIPVVASAADSAVHTIELEMTADEPDGDTVEPERFAATTVPDGQVMRMTGEHAVVDDGAQTVIMSSVDPAALGLDAPDGEVTDPGRPRPAGTREGEPR